MSPLMAPAKSNSSVGFPIKTNTQVVMAMNSEMQSRSYFTTMGERS